MIFAQFLITKLQFQFICFIYTFYISFTESFIYLTLVAAANNSLYFFLVCLLVKSLFCGVSIWHYYFFVFLAITVFVFKFTFSYMNLDNLNKPVVIFIFTTVVNGQTCLQEVTWFRYTCNPLTSCKGHIMDELLQ